MNAKLTQTPATNLNPVLNVESNGMIFYSNEAGETLLQEWGVRAGEKLPLSIIDLVQRVISRNNPEKTEIKVGNRVYLVVFSPLPEQECVTISGFEISDQRELEGKLRESEALEMANLELSEIIDIQEIKPLMDDLYKLVHIPIGINDIKGNVLVSVGWQDICSNFHRVHPETCKHCIESDKNLSAGVAPGEFKLYKCKNNMYDIVTPIMVGSEHVGYVFGGQFFFDDEPLDYELFRSQARKYGFNEEEYIAALGKVPRLSREAVETGMSFFMTFANILSKLSYSNIKLAQSLAERDAVVDTLLESEKRERARSNELAVVIDAVPASVWITHDPWALHLTGNRLSYEWLRLPEGANLSKAAPEGERPETYRMFKDGVEIPLAEMPVRMAAAGKEVRDYEFDLIYPDDTVRHLLGNAKPLRDERGNIHGAVSAFIDITQRMQTEEALKKAHDNLEEKIKERTAELEKAYNSLKESEERLVEAQIIAHIGSWERNLATDKLYWSNEVYRIFGLEPQEFELTFNSFYNCVHPEDRDYLNQAIKEALNGKPYDIDYRIILANGEERIVNAHGGAIFDENNTPIRLRGVVQDITERKKAEEALAKIEITRKKEIHHRIKNNLQVISSLLDLQAEKFKDRKCINDCHIGCIKNSEVLKAFKESQNRVISMALLHEELHRGGEIDTLNFSKYINELADNLFLTYRLGNDGTSLDMDIEEEVFFDMDTAVPLGIIVNELVSNSLKYAFYDRDKGEIRIRLHREDNRESKIEGYKSTNYVLSVADNGVGIPEDLDIEDLDSLGLQLVTTLVDQLDGELELNRDNGTKFTIRFIVEEKGNQTASPAPQLTE